MNKHPLASVVLSIAFTLVLTGPLVLWGFETCVVCTGAGASAFEEYKGGSIKNDGKRRLILLSADWCVPCQSLKANVKRNLSALGEAGIDEVLYVDCSKYTNMKKKYHPSAYPTLLIMTNGNVESRRLGSLSTEQLLKWCTK